jgi:hypothetical protein
MAMFRPAEAYDRRRLDVATKRAQVGHVRRLLRRFMPIENAEQAPQGMPLQYCWKLRAGRVDLLTAVKLLPLTKRVPYPIATHVIWLDWSLSRKFIEVMPGGVQTLTK